LNILFLVCLQSLEAQTRVLVVDARGQGDFTTIQAALNSLPDSAAAPRKIYIRKGLYKEKVYITKHQIELEGEDREHTIISQEIARDEWRCAHPDDWGVATLNLNGNDITLRNLTVVNDYGFQHPEERIVNCATDSSGKKTITANGHQMALRSILSTRVRAINCHFRAYAGDTVSPWNTVNGMFYFKDCLMEGGVDFYCPRGWAWAENCRFFANTGPASIWHDGSGNKDFKTVLKNCFFDGYAGFQLGRYHKDAQFYLVDCQFTERLADRDIYLVPTANVIRWGRRIYYYNCHREGGDYKWFRNNLENSAVKQASDITVNWLFNEQWHPQTN
jgi:pectinesterase